MKTGKKILRMKNRLLKVALGQKKGRSEHIKEVWLLNDPETDQTLRAPKKIGLVCEDLKDTIWFHPQHGYRVRCFIHEWEA